MNPSTPNEPTRFLPGAMIAGILVEYLRPIVGGITASEVAMLPKSVGGAIATLQFMVNTLTFGSFQMPGLVAVALLGIVLNIILNSRDIALALSGKTSKKR